MKAKLLFWDCVFKFKLLMVYKKLESHFCIRSINASQRYTNYMELNNPKIKDMQLDKE